MPLNRKVSGSRAGVVGLGRIGREIGDRLAAQVDGQAAAGLAQVRRHIAHGDRATDRRSKSAAGNPTDLGAVLIEDCRALAGGSPTLGAKADQAALPASTAGHALRPNTRIIARHSAGTGLSTGMRVPATVAMPATTLVPATITTRSSINRRLCSFRSR